MTVASTTNMLYKLTLDIAELSLLLDVHGLPVPFSSVLKSCVMGIDLLYMYFSFPRVYILSPPVWVWILPLSLFP